MSEEAYYHTWEPWRGEKFYSLYSQQEWYQLVQSTCKLVLQNNNLKIEEIVQTCYTDVLNSMVDNNILLPLHKDSILGMLWIDMIRILDSHTQRAFVLNLPTPEYMDTMEGVAELVEDMLTGHMECMNSSRCSHCGKVTDESTLCGNCGVPSSSYYE